MGRRELSELRRDPVAPPPPRLPPPPDVWVTKRPRLPRPQSAARQPVRRLAEAEVALAALSRRSRDLPDGPAVPDEVVERTWRVATSTAERLRSVAARIELVEIAAERAPVPERPALENGAADLLAHLRHGVAGYRTLTATAGRLLLATTPSPGTAELVEATEGLAALAEALTELVPVTELAGAEPGTRGTVEER